MGGRRDRAGVPGTYPNIRWEEGGIFCIKRLHTLINVGPVQPRVRILQGFSSNRGVFNYCDSFDEIQNQWCLEGSKVKGNIIINKKFNIMHKTYFSFSQLFTIIGAF